VPRYTHARQHPTQLQFEAASGAVSLANFVDRLRPLPRARFRRPRRNDPHSLHREPPSASTLLNSPRLHHADKRAGPVPGHPAGADHPDLVVRFAFRDFWVSLAPRPKRQLLADRRTRERRHDPVIQDRGRSSRGGWGETHRVGDRIAGSPPFHRHVAGAARTKRGSCTRQRVVLGPQHRRVPARPLCRRRRRRHHARR
jgi:hypothetical protein